MDKKLLIVAVGEATTGRTMSACRVRMRWSRDDVIVVLRHPAQPDRCAILRQSTSGCGGQRSGAVGRRK